METTIELLNKALAIKHASAWARELGITPAAITRARQRGNLSPVIAGNLAIDLGEDAQKWIAIAALEAERSNPLQERLRQTLLHTKP